MKTKIVQSLDYMVYFVCMYKSITNNNLKDSLEKAELLKEGTLNDGLTTENWFRIFILLMRNTNLVVCR